MNNNKKLYKIRSNKKICGVLAGFSEYLGADPTLIRILFVLLCLMFQPLIIVYIVAAFIMPDITEIDHY